MTARATRPLQHATPTSASTEPLRPREVIAHRFYIQEVSARGGMSTVYRAIDVDPAFGPSGREVALKLIVAQDAAAEDFAALLHVEARMLDRLRHPNIVATYGSGAEGTRHFLIMEYLRGRSLARILAEQRGRPLPRPVAFHLLREIGAGLSHCHRMGVVHGDLKPGNVFLSFEGLVKLLDFATVQFLHIFTDETEDVAARLVERVGALTPSYASPEMLAGDGPHESDDVFSLAVIAYLMLTGTHPFGWRAADAAQSAGYVPAPPRGLSASRREALAQGLALRRTGRTPTIEAFIDGLAAPDLVDRVLG